MTRREASSPSDVPAEVMEDVSFVRAIQEREASEPVTRTEVFSALDVGISDSYRVLKKD